MIRPIDPPCPSRPIAPRAAHGRPNYQSSEVGWPPLIAGGILLCGLVGGISDLAQPIGPYATIIAIASFVVLALSCMALMLLWGTRHRRLMTKAVGFIGMLAVTSIGVKAWQMLVPGGNENGALGANIEAIQKFQSSLFNIEQKLTHIEEKVDETANNSKVIVSSTQRIETKLKDVKKETSEDPLKELANLGIQVGDLSLAWANALHGGQPRIVKLVQASGWKPDLFATWSSVISLDWRTKKGRMRPFDANMIDAIRPIEKEFAVVVCNIGKANTIGEYTRAPHVNKGVYSLGSIGAKHYCGRYITQYKDARDRVANSIEKAQSAVISFIGRQNYEKCISSIASLPIECGDATGSVWELDALKKNLRSIDDILAALK